MNPNRSHREKFFFSVSIFRRLTHLCVFAVSASVFVSVCLCLSLSVQAGRQASRQAAKQTSSQAAMQVCKVCKSAKCASLQSVQVCKVCKSKCASVYLQVCGIVWWFPSQTQWARQSFQTSPASQSARCWGQPVGAGHSVVGWVSQLVGLGQLVGWVSQLGHVSQLFGSSRLGGVSLEGVCQSVSQLWVGVQVLRLGFGQVLRKVLIKF